jgi:hypothetical protein
MEQAARHTLGLDGDRFTSEARGRVHDVSAGLVLVVAHRVVVRVVASSNPMLAAVFQVSRSLVLVTGRRLGDQHLTPILHGMGATLQRLQWLATRRLPDDALPIAFLGLVVGVLVGARASRALRVLVSGTLAAFCFFQKLAKLTQAVVHCCTSWIHRLINTPSR